MKYKEPISIGRLRKLYKLVTGITAWTPILRGRKYDRKTLGILRSNNQAGMVKVVREWLDEYEKSKKITK